MPRRLAYCVAITTALEVDADPEGDVQSTSTVFVCPWVTGGVFVSVQSTDPSEEETSITYSPSSGSETSPSTCFVSPMSSKRMAPLQSSYAPASSSAHQTQNPTSPSEPSASP